MGRIPVLRTIGEAFAFAFDNYFGILGAVWLPVLVIFAGEYFAIAPAIKHIVGLAQFVATHPHETPPPEFQSQPGIVWALNLLTYIVGAWLTIAVTKEALGVRESPRFIYVSVGWAELRMMGAYLMLAAILFAVFIVLLVVSLIVVAVGASLYAGGALSGLNFHSLSGPGAALLAVVIVALVVAMIYYLLRLMFFVGPVTVAEHRFGMWRSWELSRDHGWQIFAIVAILILLMFVAELALAAMVLVPAILTVANSMAHANTHDAQAAVEAVFKTLGPFVPFVLLLIVAVMPIILGLQHGVAVFAYRALVPKGEAPAR